jgi:hypothetical protein
VNDDSMVLRKLRRLVDFPNFSIACSFAQKYHGLAMAMNFVIDLSVGQLQSRHFISSVDCEFCFGSSNKPKVDFH